MQLYVSKAERDAAGAVDGVRSALKVGLLRHRRATQKSRDPAGATAGGTVYDDQQDDNGSNDDDDDIDGRNRSSDVHSASLYYEILLVQVGWIVPPPSRVASPTTSAPRTEAEGWKGGKEEEEEWHRHCLRLQPYDTVPIRVAKTASATVREVGRTTVAGGHPWRRVDPVAYGKGDEQAVRAVGRWEDEMRAFMGNHSSDEEDNGPLPVSKSRKSKREAPTFASVDDYEEVIAKSWEKAKRLRYQGG